MNFHFPLLKYISSLLFPLATLYPLIIRIRNWCYDRNIFSSTSFNLPIICVGNLAVGGTGKSPMVELLIRTLKDQFEVAVLSRGYKRKTQGYALADASSAGLEMGDGAMQFHSKFPEVTIAVGEERMVAIPQLLHDRPDTQAIILDDAFQHRAVKAGLNILLTDYSNLFTRDWWLPSGDLRDAPGGYKRADVIIVTKCPENLAESERRSIIQEIDPLKHQQVFFSSIQYGQPYLITGGNPSGPGGPTSRPTPVVPGVEINDQMEVLLVTGIANPAPLKEWLDRKSGAYYELAYSDHHIFSIDDLHNITRRFSSIPAANKIILTTEKDAVRLVKFRQELEGWPFYVLPPEPRLLFDEQPRFTDLIVKFITNFSVTPATNLPGQA